MHSLSIYFDILSSVTDVISEIDEFFLERQED